jgi:tRNA-splicing ligase RtcB
MLMMNKIIAAFIEAGYSRESFTNNFGKLINIAHNYAAIEKHFEQDVIVHRKGATRAQSGEIGIIPGSQGAVSYIIEGLGNAESYNSCSHGAGRKMGRKQAQRSLNLQYEIERLNAKGIIHSIRGQRDLDEAPSAYKDIDTVMNNQKDLVKIKHRLTPLAVVKG